MKIKWRRLAHPTSTNVWFPLCFGLLATAIIALVLSLQNKFDDRQHIRALFSEAESIIKERFNLYEYGLRGARGAIITAGVENITRQQFERYIDTRDITKEFPGALGFGFIRKVSIDDEANFILAAQRDGMPEFKIRMLAPHQDDRFIIQYIYPIEANRQAIGLDIGSENNRREAAIAAARGNRPFLTEPITLVQANNQARRGVLILLPIYPSDPSLMSPQERERSVVGWSYAPLIIDDVLNSFPKIMEQAQITLSNLAESSPFFISEIGNGDYHDEDNVAGTIEIMGQSWNLEITPNDAAYLFHRWNISWVIGLGLSLTFILVIAVSVFQSSMTEGKDRRDKVGTGINLGIYSFVQNSLVKRTLPPIILIVLVGFLFVSWSIVEEQKNRVSQNLYKIDSQIHEELEKAVSQYRSDVISLASAPPLKYLKNQTDVVRLPYNNEYEKRLKEIFSAYMLASKYVYQVRLISAKHNWQEVIKVQRDENGINIISSSLLQSKKDEPYIDATMELTGDQVYISDINLNREYGEIEFPYRPVWRFSTPLYSDDGSSYGLIIINVEIKELLEVLRKISSQDANVYVTSSEDRYLFYRELDKLYLLNKHDLATWDTQFRAKPEGVLAIKGTAEYSNELGDFWVFHSQFSFGDSIPQRYLNIYSASSMLPVIIIASWQIFGALTFSFIMVLGGVGLQYWFWAVSTQINREKWSHHLYLQNAKELLRFKALLDSSPEATLIVDSAGVIKMANEEAVKIFDIERESLENSSIDELLPYDVRAVHGTYMQSYLNRPEKRRMGGGQPLFALRGNGVQFPVEISLNAVHMEDELLVLVSVRDVTERLENESILTNALQTAEKATDAKSVFLANTSHEIRTPLNAIIGLTYLLSNESLSESQRTLLDKINLAGKSLLGIVNDVLDLSKIEANEMSFELHPMELRILVDEIKSIFSIQAKNKDLGFEVELSDGLPQWVEADATRLKQILMNLVGNAIKFTNSGMVRLLVEIKDLASSANVSKPVFRFTVIDSGIGIAKNNIESLFIPFSQADHSTTRRFGGSGLGLSIVKQLSELMDGHVGVESEEGKGTTFWVDIPLNIISPAELENINLQSQAKLYVVVAEDNAKDAAHIHSLTHALGWRCDVVKDGSELVKLIITQFEQVLPMPDALVLDWKMPDLDGMSALKSLSSKLGKENLPGVVLSTAFDKAEIKQLDTEGLVTHILKKPVNASALFNAVNDVVCRTTGNLGRVVNATLTAEVGAKWLKNIRVLVVDDSDINLEVASYILQQSGALVKTVSSGEDAINEIKAHAHDFDAVLMDIQMPGMDGLTATRQIREILKEDPLPVIALTAGALLEERKRAIEAGMNDFLTKPISPERLIKVLRVQLVKQRGGEIPIEDITISIPDENWPTISELDMPQAKQLTMGNKTLFFNTLKHLIEDNENLLVVEDLSDRIEESEYRISLAAQIHKLRSSAGMIGSKQISILSSEAESALRDLAKEPTQILKALSSELVNLKKVATDAIQEWEDGNHLSMDTQNISEKESLDLVTRLIDMLEIQDLNALTVVEEKEIILYSILGKETFKVFGDAISRLNFETAKETLASFAVDGRKSNG